MDSQVRQNYHRDCEAAVNRMLNMELFASYSYTSMVRNTLFIIIKYTELFASYTYASILRTKLNVHNFQNTAYPSAPTSVYLRGTIFYSLLIVCTYTDRLPMCLFVL